jgi:ATP-binding cassette subfamily C (CFTR/MRP) protein 4
LEEDSGSPFLFEEIEEADLQEEKWINSLEDPNGRNWPSEGRIEFENVFMKYSKEGKEVLQSVSFSVNSREKVGIVGRTGAGKVFFFISFSNIFENIN